MQALVKTARGKGNRELRNVPTPQIAPDEVLIRVHACGICGSDFKIQDDEHPYTPPVVRALSAWICYDIMIPARTVEYCLRKPLHGVKRLEG